MLHILLLILKIIGIIMLVLLSLIILSIIVFIFAPVRYSLHASRTEAESAPPFTVHGRLTFLGGLFNIRLRYPDRVYLRVRIAIFTIFKLPQSERKTKHKRRSKDITSEKSDLTTKSAADTSYIADKQNPTLTEENKDANTTEMLTDNEIAHNFEDELETSSETETTSGFDNNIEDMSSDEVEEDTPLEDETAENLSLFDKIKQFIASIGKFITKIKDFFLNIKCTFSNFCAKIKELCNDLDYYKSILQSDEFVQAFQLVKKELGILFGRIKPSKFKMQLSVGMADPYTTGQILSIYGILFPLIGNNVTVDGDFTKVRLEGECKIKGKIRMSTFIRLAFKLYFNKNVKKLIRMFKKEE